MTMSAILSLPGKLDSLYQFMEFVTSFARERKLGVEKISRIELATEEVLVNIIKHARRDCKLDGNIEITCKLAYAAQGLIIEISDYGVPFDILSAPEPDMRADISERQIGGLGIFFVKQLMDEVIYRREDNQNKVTLIINNTD